MISLLEIAQSINEVDDDEIIKYKDKDGESAEMKAGSAKTMPDEHPAKIAYNKMKDSDSGEKDSGGKLSGSDFDRDSDDKDDEPADDEKPKDKPKGKLTQKGEKIQKAKEEFDDLMGDGGDPDEIGMWIDDNRYNLSGDGNPENISRAFSKLEDAYMKAEEDDDWDAYEEQLEDLKNKISKRLDTMVDLNREEPKSDKPKDDSSKKSNLVPLSSLDTYYNKEKVKNSMSPAEWKKLSYGELSNLLDKEHEKAGHKKVNGQWMKKESIKVINGKKYKPIKESKKNPRILKEIYDRTFRSLK